MKVNRPTGSPPTGKFPRQEDSPDRDIFDGGVDLENDLKIEKEHEGYPDEKQLMYEKRIARLSFISQISP